MCLWIHSFLQTSVEPRVPPVSVTRVGCMRVCFPQMPSILQQTHTWKWSSSFSHNYLVSFTQTAKYDTKRSPGGYPFHTGFTLVIWNHRWGFLAKIFKVFISSLQLLGNNCTQSCSRQECCAEKEVMYSHPWWAHRVDSWVGTDGKPSLALQSISLIPLSAPPWWSKKIICRKKDAFLPFVWI